MATTGPEAGAKEQQPVGGQTQYPAFGYYAVKKLGASKVFDKIGGTSTLTKGSTQIARPNRLGLAINTVTNWYTKARDLSMSEYIGASVATSLINTCGPQYPAPLTDKQKQTLINATAMSMLKGLMVYPMVAAVESLSLVMRGILYQPIISPFVTKKRTGNFPSRSEYFNGLKLGFLPPAKRLLSKVVLAPVDLVAGIAPGVSKTKTAFGLPLQYYYAYPAAAAHAAEAATVVAKDAQAAAVVAKDAQAAAEEADKANAALPNNPNPKNIKEVRIKNAAETKVAETRAAAEEAQKTADTLKKIADEAKKRAAQKAAAEAAKAAAAKAAQAPPPSPRPPVATPVQSFTPAANAAKKLTTVPQNLPQPPQAQQPSQSSKHGPP